MAQTHHLILVPHTHWDREWYLTFQQFRMKLVRAVDKVLEALETDPEFFYFMLDGQTIVLEDYLEVRPENAERLQRLAQQGRLLIGPWYLQPDEFLVGGESLIRNLQIGRRMAEPYGGAMPVGYVPDTFGHIAQLPQILRGFGFDNAVFWRGLLPEIDTGAFRWAAPDGSDVLVVWLHDGYGYSNAAVLPLDPAALTQRITQVVARMQPREVTDTLLLMNGSDHLEPQLGLPQVLDAARAQLREHGLDIVIGTLPQYIATLCEADLPLARASGEMRSGQRAHLLPGVLSTRMWLKQRNAEGEALLTRWAEPSTAWAAVLGSPYQASLLSISWKHLLHNHPHDSICGCGIDQVHAEMLPRFAQSRQIAEELTTQALTYLAAKVDTAGPDRALPLVVFNPAPGPRTDVVRAEAHVLLSSFEVVDADGHVVPHQIHSSRGVELLNQTADKDFVLASLGMIGDGRVLDYAILDAHMSAGKEPGSVMVDVVVSQQGEPDLVLIERMKARLAELAARDDVTAFHLIAREAPKIDILLLARDVPAHGGRVLFLRPRVETLFAKPTVGVAPGTSFAGGHGRDIVHAGELTLENAHLAIRVDPTDGTLALTDKRTGVEYAGLNAVADGGDVGDLYNYSPPACDTLIMDPAWPPSVEIVESGPARASLRVERTYYLPVACAPDRQSRSAESARCLVTSEVALAAGARRVEIRTTVENTVRDHRLRVLFPTPFAVTHADAEGAFEVAHRPAQKPAPDDWRAAGWTEQPVSTQPQKRFVDVSDGEHGLAVLNRGLPEYEVLPAAASGTEGTGSGVALTLLRGVEWLSRDDLLTRKSHAGPALHTPEGQGIGTHMFDYALVPHAGTWQTEDGFVLQEAQAFEAPLRAVVATQH
ncbi:MAG TPA: glycoside hydrolase family 38 C-terminal domain-containing protein, partial [Ktedonobacterales bacterium]|nr:glycoside hydrolase family 38 C-terminal domain-containing protein [Ktedonobacterales bacterium]